MSDLDKWGIDLTPDEADTFMAAICEARRGPDLPDPLVALRAEVERERADAEHAFTADRTDASAQIAQFCFALVLDLIDKHIREGQ